jgi:hypothetical protein
VVAGVGRFWSKWTLRWTASPDLTALCCIDLRRMSMQQQRDLGGSMAARFEVHCVLCPITTTQRNAKASFVCPNRAGNRRRVETKQGRTDLSTCLLRHGVLSGNVLKHWRYARSCSMLCSCVDGSADPLARRHGVSEESRYIRFIQLVGKPLSRKLVCVAVRAYVRFGLGVVAVVQHDWECNIPINPRGSLRDKQ